MPTTSERIPIELDTRLSALDEVDRKIGEIIEATKDWWVFITLIDKKFLFSIGNLEKDKQVVRWYQRFKSF